jgi:hypothetical protein
VAEVRGLALGMPAAPLLVVPLFVPGEPTLELTRPLLLIWRLASALGEPPPPPMLVEPPVPIAPAEPAEPLEAEPPEPTLAACAILLHASKSACIAACAEASLPSASSHVAARAAVVVRVKLAITDSSCERLESNDAVVWTFKRSATDAAGARRRAAVLAA